MELKSNAVPEDEDESWMYETCLACAGFGETAEGEACDYCDGFGSIEWERE